MIQAEGAICNDHAAFESLPEIDAAGSNRLAWKTSCMELVRTPFGPDPVQRPSLDKGASERLSRSSRLQTELSSND